MHKDSKKKYPNRGGIPIPLHEIMDLGRMELTPKNCDNHHYCWEASEFTQYVLYSVLRDLDSLQEILNKDVHIDIHRLYNPPKFPKPAQAYSYILEAEARGEKLKTGSVSRPKYSKISNKVIDAVCKNYKELSHENGKKLYAPNPSIILPNIDN